MIIDGVLEKVVIDSRIPGAVLWAVSYTKNYVGEKHPIENGDFLTVWSDDEEIVFNSKIRARSSTRYKGGWVPEHLAPAAWYALFDSVPPLRCVLVTPKDST